MNILALLVKNFLSALGIDLKSTVPKIDLIGVCLDKPVLFDSPTIFVKVLVYEDLLGIVDLVLFVSWISLCHRYNIG